MADPFSGALFYDVNSGAQKYLDGSNGIKGWVPYDVNVGGNTGGGQVLGASTDTRTGYTGGTGGSAPSYDPNDMAYLDQQQSFYDRLLRSADSTLNSGLQSINDSTNAARNKATTQQERAMRDFNVRRQDTQVAKQDALGKVDTNARTLADSLRRMLGMTGGSGSSAYRFAAPNAVARQASQQRSGVMTNFGQNERDLDTAVSDTNVDFESLLNEIMQQRRDREEELRAGITTQRQGIYQGMGDIAAERARLQGGDPLSAMRPYESRYMQLQDSLDSLPGRFRNAVSARDLNVKTPSLRDYVVDRQAINANRQGPQSQYSPYLNFLKKDEERVA